MLNNTHIEWIDRAKALSILLVIVYHSTGILGLQNYTVGQTGVDVFLIISGYTLTLRRRQESPLTFYKRRFMAIGPAYWIILLLGSAGLFFAVGQPIIWPVVASHLLFLHGFHETHFFGIVNSLWFMTAIAFFYVIFPFLRKFIEEGRVNLLLALSILLMFLLGLFFAVTQPEYAWKSATYSHFVVRIPSFFFGIILAVIQFGKADFERDSGLLALAIIAMIGAATATSVGFGIIYTPLLGCLFFCGVYVISIATQNSLIGRVLKWIGDYSYEIYLVHEFYMLRANAVLARLIVPNATGKEAILIGLIAGFVLTLVTAIILKKIVNLILGMVSQLSVRRESIKTPV